MLKNDLSPKRSTVYKLIKNKKHLANVYWQYLYCYSLVFVFPIYLFFRSSYIVHRAIYNKGTLHICTMLICTSPQNNHLKCFCGVYGLRGQRNVINDSFAPLPLLHFLLPFPFPWYPAQTGNIKRLNLSLYKRLFLFRWILISILT